MPIYAAFSIIVFTYYNRVSFIIVVFQSVIFLRIPIKTCDFHTSYITICDWESFLMPLSGFMSFHEPGITFKYSFYVRVKFDENYSEIIFKVYLWNFKNYENYKN